MATVPKGISTSKSGLRALRIPPLVGPLLILVFLILLVTLINPRFLSSANVSNLLRQSSILLIVAIGETYIIMMGSIDLSVEGVMAITSVIIGLLAENYFNSNDFGIFAVLIAV
ncbi:MAG: hypothetical protein ACWGO1_09235, partial [Anaerolineales bacterium]